MNRIIQDVFPATVAIASADFPVDLLDMQSQPPTKDTAYIATARVIVTDTEIMIVREASNGPFIAFREAIDPANFIKSSNPRTLDSRVVTLNGTKIVFRKDSACGCGSRLKSWHPYATMST